MADESATVCPRCQRTGCVRWAGGDARFSYSPLKEIDEAATWEFGHDRWTAAKLEAERRLYAFRFPNACSEDLTRELGDAAGNALPRLALAAAVFRSKKTSKEIRQEERRSARDWRQRIYLTRKHGVRLSKLARELRHTLSEAIESHSYVAQAGWPEIVNSGRAQWRRSCPAAPLAAFPEDQHAALAEILDDIRPQLELLERIGTAAADWGILKQGQKHDSERFKLELMVAFVLQEHGLPLKKLGTACLQTFSTLCSVASV
jgi:hypothetical protein